MDRDFSKRTSQKRSRRPMRRPGLCPAEADVAGNYDDISPVKQAGTYVIEGHVTGVAAGAVFFLMDLDFEGGSSIARGYSA